MPTQFLPWFHSTSLRQRFAAHAQASLAAGTITVQEHQWLELLHATDRDHQPTALRQMRVDSIAAILSDGQRVDLPATVRLSRGGHSNVVMLYNPLMGLRRFADPLQLKQFLLEHIGKSGWGAALRFAATATQQLAMKRHQVEAFQGSLLSGDVFDALMLRMQAGLADNLAQLRGWVRNQPTPDAMLAADKDGPIDPAVRASTCLAQYWNDAAATSAPLCEQLGMALQTTLLHHLLHSRQAGRLEPEQYRQLAVWAIGLDAETALALRVFSLRVSTLENQSVPLDDLLVLSLPDHTGSYYIYRAADGVQCYPSRRALLADLSDPLRRDHWLLQVSSSGRALLQTLRINALCLDPTPIQTLQGYANALLARQRSRLHEALSTDSSQTPLRLCQQALDLDQYLDPHLRIMAPLFPADIRDDPASLNYVGGAILRDAHNPQQLLTHLADLDLQYARYQARGPDLASVSASILQLEMACVLEDGPAALSIQLPAPNLPQALWQNEDADLSQAFIQVAEGVQQPVDALPKSLMTSILQRARRQLRASFEQAVQHREALSGGYYRKLRYYLNELETRLDHKPAQRPAALQENIPDSTARQAWRLQTFDHLMAGSWPSESLPDLMRQADPSDSLAQALEHYRDLARRQIQIDMIPPWLAQATAAQKNDYLKALAYNLLSSPVEQDYLLDLQDIPAFAQDRLQSQLDIDFTPGRFKPQAIFVTTQRYVSAPPLPGEIPSAIPAATVSHRQSLVQYALNHYRDWDAALTAIELGSGHPAPPELDAAYVRQRVRALDLGNHYQVMLEQAFTATDVRYSQRLALYCRQLPGQLIERAWRAHLMGDLSLQAVQLVTQVMLAPEGQLRKAGELGVLDFTPLQLIPGPGLQPDCVPDSYLFIARGTGLCVLYLPYEASVPLQAFGGTAALLQALIDDSALQQRVLARMPGQWRSRYDHGGFREAHLNPSSTSGFDYFPAPGPVRLGSTPIAGNLLHFLFEDNARYLVAQSKTQFITAAQAQWNAFVNVLSLAWEQLPMFLPGKMGLILAAWQLEFKTLQVVEAAEQHKWGQNLLELTCALIQGALIGHGVAKLENVPTSLEQFWQAMREDEQYGVSLAGYESPGQALHELYFEASTGSYATRTTYEHFVSLRSRLYRVRQEGDQWFLAGEMDEELGPLLNFDPQLGWAISVPQALPLYEGGVPSRLGGRLTRWTLSRDQVVILAVGARKIRELMPQRARMLRHAHRDALTYLGIALDNLHRAIPTHRAPAATLEIIARFFGTPQVSDALVRRIRQSLEKLVTVMASRAYSPVSSKRYIMGRRLSPASSVGIAFMSALDPQKQVFLLDEFFEFDTARHLPLAPTFTPDDANALSKAMVLLHEFTHIACDTRDIRYLEAATPYVERLQPGVRRAWLEHEHDELFSHLTPSRRLFTVRDDVTGQIRDLRNDDRKGRALILRIAASPDLVDARRRFLDNADIRSRIMLMNADSLTLLIYRLGQRRHLD